MIALHVWLRTRAGGLLPAGEIRVAEPDPRRGGLLRGEFRYHATFLDHPDAFALDPARRASTNSAMRTWRTASGG